MQNNGTYCVYLLECCDGTLYCGITTDMQHRLKQHNAGTASRYTRGRAPVKVLAKTPDCYSKSAALKLEHRVKKAPRHKKADKISNAIMEIAPGKKNLQREKSRQR